MASSPDISFEHFNPQSELSIIDSNGKTTRIRKKPGRKPNPPSPAQRKAQNRAAQRAFRERKRCEMKQAHATVKQCICIRDQALGEAQRLKTELEETRYENNYLKGSLLILKLACIANGVDVPNLSDNTDSSSAIGLSCTKRPPHTMDIFLDKHRNIINLAHDNDSPSPTAFLPSSPMSLPLSPESFVCSPLSPMMDLHQHETCPLLSSSPGSTYSGSNGYDSVQDIPSTIMNPSQCLSLESCHLYSPKLSNIDYDNNSTEFAPLSAVNSSNPATTVNHELVNESLNNETMLDFAKWMDATALAPQPTPIFDPKTGMERLRTTVPDRKDDHFGASLLSLSASQLESAPPMSTVEALQYIRRVKNIDSDTRTLFKPTEIQCMVPHDTRIDQVPCPMMRDLMILYQDFYDANELCDLLMGSAMFLGGNLESFDDWKMPPVFVYKFWFLLPDYQLQRLGNLLDSTVKMGQKLIKIMIERKSMYFENGHFTDDFHFTETTQRVQLHQQQQQSRRNDQDLLQYQEVTHESDRMTFDTFSKDDSSLDAMMTFVDDNDLLLSV